MRTFSIQTLGCKVNQYESEQMAQVLRSRGLLQVPCKGDLRIINTCSVTRQAASKSRQMVRRSGTRTIVTGCWATSDPAQARQLPNVHAVLTHYDDVAEQLGGLLDLWAQQDGTSVPPERSADPGKPLPVLPGNKVWINSSQSPGSFPTSTITSSAIAVVKEKFAGGTSKLPLLRDRQSSHQRGLLKIQDGCQAHCTYCIIPRLRPQLWSKPIEDVVKEATALVAVGHVELVLTGICLSAYEHFGELIDALCTSVPGLQRVRLSSLEPGDVTADLIDTLKGHQQVVPHFHVPLQSGSDDVLRRMNRQYRRDDFLRMVDGLKRAFDRPALTTDIIVGFPGETAARFEETLGVVDGVGFTHIHAFSFSPRPGTAAASWNKDFVRGPVVNQRMKVLADCARRYSFWFRRQFLGQTMEVLVERPSAKQPMLHGRTTRYFPVYFDGPRQLVGRPAQVRIERVTPQRTVGRLVGC